MYPTKILASRLGVLMAVAIVAGPQAGLAEYKVKSMPGLSVSGEYRTENIFGENENDIISQRNEFKFDIDYEKLMGGGGKGVRVDFHAQLRPFYDSVFDLSAGGMSENGVLEDRWETNIDWTGDKRDPLLREFYFDVTANNTDMRLGRQIVAWGKSDGVFMLDLINPFNLRNPFKFEEEDIKIPLWMINFNQRIGADSTIQLIWSPIYTRAQYPGFHVADTVGGGALAFAGGKTGEEEANHAFGLKGVEVVNEYYQAFFGNPVTVNEPGRVFADSTAGARWSSVLGDLNYTLNYLYTWTQIMGDFGNTGNAYTDFAFERRPERMHVAGASWDYPLNMLPGPFEGMVWRGETAMFFNDMMFNADVEGYTSVAFPPFPAGNPNFFHPEKVDHHGLMMGFDQNFNIDLLPFIDRAYLDPTWFVSVQYWQDWILDPLRSKNAYYDSGAGTDWAALATFFADPNSTLFTEGRRDDFKSQVTLFILKDLLPGDVLHTEWFALYGIQNKEAWLRGKLRYEVNDDLTVAIGANKFLGGDFDPYGQFQDSDHVFLELRYSFF